MANTQINQKKKERGREKKEKGKENADRFGLVNGGRKR